MPRKSTDLIHDVDRLIENALSPQLVDAVDKFSDEINRMLLKMLIRGQCEQNSSPPSVETVPADPPKSPTQGDPVLKIGTWEKCLGVSLTSIDVLPDELVAQVISFDDYYHKMRSICLTNHRFKSLLTSMRSAWTNLETDADFPYAPLPASIPVTFIQHLKIGHAIDIDLVKKFLPHCSKLKSLSVVLKTENIQEESDFYHIPSIAQRDKDVPYFCDVVLPELEGIRITVTGNSLPLFGGRYLRSLSVPLPTTDEEFFITQVPIHFPRLSALELLIDTPDLLIRPLAQLQELKRLVLHFRCHSWSTKFWECAVNDLVVVWGNSRTINGLLVTNSTISNESDHFLELDMDDDWSDVQTNFMEDIQDAFRAVWRDLETTVDVIPCDDCDRSMMAMYMSEDHGQRKLPPIKNERFYLDLWYDRRIVRDGKGPCQKIFYVIR